MPKLTTEMLHKLTPTSARLELRDDDEPGLIFRLAPSGAKSWSLRYVIKSGEHRRKTLGKFPAIGLAAARNAARKIKGGVASHVDVVGIERQERQAARLRGSAPCRGWPTSISPMPCSACTASTAGRNGRPRSTSRSAISSGSSNR